MCDLELNLYCDEQNHLIKIILCALWLWENSFNLKTVIIKSDNKTFILGLNKHKGLIKNTDATIWFKYTFQLWQIINFWNMVLSEVWLWQNIFEENKQKISMIKNQNNLSYLSANCIQLMTWRLKKTSICFSFYF